jgi:signal transduction histidine kinase
MINSYPGEIRQVLSTFLLNAMDAVPAGRTIAIRIRKSPHGNNGESNGVRITIADNGVGIPRTMLLVSSILSSQRRESKALD